MTDDMRPLIPFAEGIWLDTEPVRILGMRLTATMAVLRLEENRLLLFSPIKMTPARQAAVQAIGSVAHLYAPNLFHHHWIGDWAAAFPSARLHAPSGLSKKRPDLHIDRVHEGIPEPAFTGILDEVTIKGFRLEESVLIYRPTRTLLVADLIHNIGQPQHFWTKLYTKMMGFYGRIALSRAIRWTSFTDRTAARRSINKILEQPFDRLIVGHGTPLHVGGKHALTEAFSWLLDSTKAVGS